MIKKDNLLMIILSEISTKWCIFTMVIEYNRMHKGNLKMATKEKTKVKTTPTKDPSR